MTVIRVENVSKSYGSKEQPTLVLNHINLQIEAGEFVAIMGPSGSGKSTLMHLIGGLDRPSSGNIWLRDGCISALDDTAISRIRRRQMGFIFQFYNLIPVLTAAENVAMPLILDRVKRSEALKHANDLLATIGLKDRAHHLPSQLSGGQQQRVAIARALVTNPLVVMGDEPTGALDTHTGDDIVQLLRYTVQELKHTVVIVTHDPRVAANAHRIVHLRDGEIVDDNRMNDGSNALRERLSIPA